MKSKVYMKNPDTGAPEEVLYSQDSILGSIVPQEEGQPTKTLRDDLTHLRQLVESPSGGSSSGYTDAQIDAFVQSIENRLVMIENSAPASLFKLIGADRELQATVAEDKKSVQLGVFQGVTSHKNLVDSTTVITWNAVSLEGAYTLFYDNADSIVKYCTQLGVGSPETAIVIPPKNVTASSTYSGRLPSDVLNDEEVWISSVTYANIVGQWLDVVVPELQGDSLLSRVEIGLVGVSGGYAGSTMEVRAMRADDTFEVIGTYITTLGEVFKFDISPDMSASTTSIRVVCTAHGGGSRAVLGTVKIFTTRTVLKITDTSTEFKVDYVSKDGTVEDVDVVPLATVAVSSAGDITYAKGYRFFNQ